MIKRRGVYKNKKAQAKLSFGMIFSIILIIAFIVFAFYAIQKFVGLQQTLRYTEFIEELEADVESAWKSNQVSREFEHIMPNGVDEVCFVKSCSGLGLDYLCTSEDNLVFKHSRRKYDGTHIDHLDLDNSITSGNKLCFEVVNSRVKFMLEKDYGEELVTISKVSE